MMSKLAGSGLICALLASHMVEETHGVIQRGYVYYHQYHNGVTMDSDLGDPRYEQQDQHGAFKRVRFAHDASDAWDAPQQRGVPRPNLKSEPRSEARAQPRAAFEPRYKTRNQKTQTTQRYSNVNTAPTYPNMVAKRSKSKKTTSSQVETTQQPQQPAVAAQAAQAAQSAQSAQSLSEQSQQVSIPKTAATVPANKDATNKDTNKGSNKVLNKRTDAKKSQTATRETKVTKKKHTTLLFYRDFNQTRNLVIFGVVISLLTVAIYSVILLIVSFSRVANATDQTATHQQTQQDDEQATQHNSKRNSTQEQEKQAKQETYEEVKESRE